MLSVKYRGETEHNNTKGLIFRLTPSVDYGVNGVGDLVDLTPNKVADPTLSYNLIVDEPPNSAGILNCNLGGSYVALLPNAVPTLANLGLLVYEPGGAREGNQIRRTRRVSSPDTWILLSTSHCSNNPSR